MTLHEMIDQIEINVNELGARPYIPSPITAEHDLGALTDALQQIQSCQDGVCAIKSTFRPKRPAKQ